MTELSIGKRFDGRFNVWRRGSKELPWVIVQTCATLEAAESWVRIRTKANPGRVKEAKKA